MTDFIKNAYEHLLILEKVGQGGIGTVYKAVDLDQDRLIALKVIPPEVARHPKLRSHFEPSVKKLLGLSHPNILPILEYSKLDGYIYIVMPFMEGGSLHDRQYNEPLTWQECCRMASQVASALEYSHQHGLVHRDVKPSNILFDGGCNALLTDFDFAYVLDGSPSTTYTGMYYGTPAYMSPEQCLGKLVDGRSDIYSLGAILYRLITGRLPFSGNSHSEVMLKQIQEQPQRPTTFNPDVPEMVNSIVLKALAKDPSQRFASANEFYDSLQVLQAGFPDLLQIQLPHPDYHNDITLPIELV